MDVAELQALYEKMKVPRKNALDLGPGEGARKTEAVAGFLLLAEMNHPPADPLLRPATRLTGDELLLSCLHYACAVAARYIEDGSIYVPQLDADLSLLETEVVPFSIEGGVAARRRFAGYQFAETRTHVLFEIFHSGPKIARVLLRRIAYNIANDVPVPYEARVLAGRVLEGTLELPKRPASRPDDVHRDTLLVALAKRLHQTAGYPVAGSPATFVRGKPVPIRGCTIAAAALSAYKIRVDAARARKIAEKASSLLSAVRDPGELTRPALISWDVPDVVREDPSEPLQFDSQVFAGLSYLNGTI